MDSIQKEYFTNTTKFGKILCNIVNIILYIWQLPQNIVGLVYRIILRGEKVILKQRGIVFYIAPTISGGVSLGKYIFISNKSGLMEPIYDHEFGHCIQSIILGPLYLPIIGLCSGVHCMLHNPKHNYYDFWTEKWANSLGLIEGYKGEFHYHKPGVIYTNYEKLKSVIMGN